MEPGPTLLDVHAFERMRAERAKLYQHMQEIEHDEAPSLLVAHSIVFEAMRSNVTGYKQSPLGTHAFEGVDIQ